MLPDDERSERERLEAFFAKLHRDDPEPPPFRRMWRNRRGRPRRRTFPALRLALASGLAVAVVASALWLAMPRSPRLETPPIEIILADSPFGWQGPLDFLLETPGRDYLMTLPQVAAEAVMPWPDESFAIREETDP